MGLAASWSAPQEGEVARLRSELCGLGASLMLMGPKQLLCLRPADAFEPIAASQLSRAEFEELVSPVPPSSRGVRPASLRLAILNPSGDAVWSQHVSEEQPCAALVDALSRARRCLLAGPGRTYGITRRELITNLVRGFELTFGDACRPGASTSAPDPSGRGSEGAPDGGALGRASPLAHKLRALRL